MAHARLRDGRRKGATVHNTLLCEARRRRPDGGALSGGSLLREAPAAQRRASRYMALAAQRPSGLRLRTAASARGLAPSRCRAARSRMPHAARRATRCAATPPGEYSNETKLRSEAQARAALWSAPRFVADASCWWRDGQQAPFRVLRQFLAGALGASAAIGGGVSFIQLATGLAGAPSAPPVAQSGQNLAIDVAVGALMLFFWRRDEAARQKQMARISREETLGALRVSLASNKTVKLQALRGFARVVLAAGPPAFVEAAAAAAEPHREALLARGVVFVPFVTEGPALAADAAPATAAEKRWRADPLYPAEWTRWLGDQMSAASVRADTGVYVSLRLDGRVRASGVGLPPWSLLAASLPPVDGFFGGFLDGMDGRVGSE